MLNRLVDQSAEMQGLDPGMTQINKMFEGWMQDEVKQNITF